MTLDKLRMETLDRKDSILDGFGTSFAYGRWAVLITLEIVD